MKVNVKLELDLIQLLNYLSLEAKIYHLQHNDII